ADRRERLDRAGSSIDDIEDPGLIERKSLGTFHIQGEGNFRARRSELEDRVAAEIGDKKVAESIEGEAGRLVQAGNEIAFHALRREAEDISIAIRRKKIPRLIYRKKIWTVYPRGKHACEPFGRDPDDRL